MTQADLSLESPPWGPAWAFADLLCDPKLSLSLSGP